MAEDGAIYPFLDEKIVPDVSLAYNGTQYQDPGNVIVVDNGSYNLRAGWSFNADPSVICKPVMARTRREKNKESQLLVANDLTNIEAFRFNLKTPFDKNVVTQFEWMETILDYAFAKLGLNECVAGAVNHPVVMTEPVANPNSCRRMMSELLFECYSVPSLCFGVDALFSRAKHVKGELSDTTLIISCGFHTVHFLPVVDGHLSREGVKRLNVGGFQLVNYLQRCMQMKYPAHVNNITVSRAEELLHRHCHIAKEYCSELGQWKSHNYYDKNVHKMQLPFTPAPKPAPVDREVARQRRQELVKRLVEMNAKKRQEKLAADESLVKSLQVCFDLLEQGYDEKVKKMLAKLGVSGVRNAADISDLLAKTKARIDKAKSAKAKRKAERNAPHVQEADLKSDHKRSRDDMSVDERESFDEWIRDIRNKRQEVLDRRAARHHRKQQLAKRRTAASQERMRMISHLAKSSKRDDNFGMNDDDWDVYKQIRKDADDSDSEEDQALLGEYESTLRVHDPDFVADEAAIIEIGHDSPEWHQIHLATERIRVPEILFQPSIMGVDQAGISETLEYILKKYPCHVQQRLVDNVFITGALANLPGFKERLESDVQQFRPFGSSFRVTMAGDAELDAWRGARMFGNDPGNVTEYFMTKAEYDERGGDSFKENPYSCMPSSHSFDSTN